MTSIFDNNRVYNLLPTVFLTALCLVPISFFFIPSYNEFFLSSKKMRILMGILLFFYYYILLLFVRNRIKSRQERAFHSLSNFNKLQLDFLEKQLNAHFLFNILNTISTKLLRGEHQESYKLLNAYAKVMRYTYGQKTQLLHSLQSELFLVRQYLMLQSNRFNNKFTSEIHIDENLNFNTMIPRNLIQVHVDNAINHGIMQLPENGKISITISSEENFIVISIEDNGIGITSSKSKKTLIKSGNSVKLLTRIVNYYNDLYNRDIFTHQQYDLQKNGVPSGSRIVYRIESGDWENRKTPHITSL